MWTKLSSKGQVVIPKAVRQALGLRSGTRLQVRLDEGRIILERVDRAPIDILYGKYANADLLADLEVEHRQEIGDDTAVCA